MSYKKISITNLTLIFILVFGVILRFYQLGSFPTTLTVDEASYGYNAYSIVETGKDEHGTSYPLFFMAFGDQKLPGLAYSTALSVKIFGLNNFAVRLPSALAGSFLILISFLLLRQIGFGKTSALFGAFITAVAPWTVILSRFGLESNLALLLYTTALWLALKAIIEKKALFFIPSSILLATTWYFYISYRPVGIITLALGICFYLFSKFESFRPKQIIRSIKEIPKESIKTIILSLLLFLIFVLPLLSSLFSEEGTARFRQTSLFYDEGPAMEVNSNRSYCAYRLPQNICSLISNKPIIYLFSMTSRYSELFSPNYLFIEGERDLEVVNVEHFGLFPHLAVVIYFIGLSYLIFGSDKIIKSKKIILFLIVLFIVATLPALLAGGPQKVRMSPVYPLFLILLVLGFEGILHLIRTRLIKKIFIILSFGYLLIFGIYFMMVFMFINFDKHNIAHGYHLKDLAFYIEEQKDTPIYMTSFLPRPSLYYAYYTQLDPRIYQKTMRFKQPHPNGFMDELGLENIQFTDKTLDQIICSDVIGDFIYITDHGPFKEMEKNVEKADYVIRSFDGSHVLGYAFKEKPNPESEECEALVD